MLAVRVLALCSVVIQGYGVVAIGRSIQWRRLLPFVAGGAITVPFAVHWLVGLSSPMFAFGLGVFLIAYGFYMLAKQKIGTRTARNEWRRSHEQHCARAAP